MAEQAQGTEYTLQGVMRFLQLEWHAHERARNAWDIERAELKAKIAKQEGDCRSSKKINESLTKHIRMLERALKNERAKTRAIQNGEKPPSEEDVKKEWGGKIGMKNHSAEQDKTSDGPLQQPEDPAAERDAQRDKSKVFLQKCIEELSYLLTPPSHPLPPHPDLQDHAADAPPEIYFEPPPSHMVQQKRSNAGLSHLPSLPNHHPPPQQRPVPEYYAPHSIQRGNPAAPALTAPSSHPQDPPPSVPVATVEEIQDRPGLPSNQAPPRILEDINLDNMGQNYDDYRRSMQPREESQVVEHTYTRQEENSGWDFDDDVSGSSDHAANPGALPIRSRELDTNAVPIRPDAELFPNANSISTAKSPPRTGRRRRSSGSVGVSQRRRSDDKHEIRDLSASRPGEDLPFKVCFALRGHLDVVRSVIFTGGGSPSEPEVCTTGDDGLIKRWIIPGGYGPQQPPNSPSNDLDIQAYFTHRGHEGIVTSLASCPASSTLATGGRAIGDGWIFSGGADATVRVWERGRVDPKATIDGHTDAIWALCILPGNGATVFGSSNSNSPDGSTLSAPHPAASADRVLLVSGSADGTVKVWAVSAPPPALSSPSSGAPGSRRGVGGSRRHSVTSGSGFPSSPQPSTASSTPFHYTLIHSIAPPAAASASPTSIVPLGANGESFVVSYNDASVAIYDTRTGEQIIGMASAETYDGTPATGVNAVVVTTSSTNSAADDNNKPVAAGDADDEAAVHGATGSSKDGGVEGVIVSGHEDRYVRFFDANSGQCTYSMLAHPSSIAALSASPDGRELVTAGHDAALRFWSLARRACSQEITSHRACRGEGVVCVVWSQDGRWVVSGGGDGVVKVFAR